MNHRQAKAEAEEAIAELIVREALVQITDTSQCVALRAAIELDEVIRAHVSQTAFSDAIDAVADDLGVITQVNPAAESMLQYLRDPSLVEADARAAEQEAAKDRRSALASKMAQLGKSARASTDENDNGEQKALLSAIIDGFREHPAFDQNSLAVELFCAAVENLSTVDVQNRFLAAFRPLVCFFTLWMKNAQNSNAIALMFFSLIHIY